MVHHLLTHTSGLRGEDVMAHATAMRGTVTIPPPEETQDPAINELLCLRYGAPLWKPPGEEMNYSGINYDFLGEIVRRVSGRALAEFAEERIFAPLGMKDTHYVVPEGLAHRVSQRAPNVPFAQAGYGTRQHQTLPSASGGAYSTALDMAVFGQMFLNRGRYGDARVLSPPTVAEMTRNQIPGISATFLEEYWPEALWGYGWHIHGNSRSLYFDGTLHSPQAFDHAGASGVFIWVDPVYEIVGGYYSVPVEQVRDYFR